jgi:hypothetical protein
MACSFFLTSCTSLQQTTTAATDDLYFTPSKEAESTTRNNSNEAAASEEKLTHLEHAEDHVINDGMEGFAHAYHNLEDVKDQVNGKKNKTKIATKYDGSPSIVFGHHPETGAFFVASKSVFNKDPKLNYTHEDIEKNR